MQKLWRIYLPVLCILAGCSDEPRYHGTTLSKWLIRYQKADPLSTGEQRAETAVRAIGTNALPYLTTWITSKDLDECARAKQGFAILGSAAAPAVPQLAALLNGTNELRGTLAGEALGSIGAPAVPALLQALTNKNYKISENAMQALPHLGTNARPAIPLLLEELNRINYVYRVRSAAALAGLQIDAETLVPVLTKLLQDPSPVVRFWAVSGLTQFGSQARPAAASLMAMMQDENDRHMARSALIKIAPDMLAQPRAK